MADAIEKQRLLNAVAEAFDAFVAGGSDGLVILFADDWAFVLGTSDEVGEMIDGLPDGYEVTGEHAASHAVTGRLQ